MLGQKVNVGKSSLITYAKFLEERMEALKIENDFVAQKSCFEYLDVPVFQGRTNGSQFGKMVTRVRNKVSVWGKVVIKS